MASWTVPDRDVDINPPEAQIVEEDYEGQEIYSYQDYYCLGDEYYTEDKANDFLKIQLKRLDRDDLINLVEIIIDRNDFKSVLKGMLED